MESTKEFENEELKEELLRETMEIDENGMTSVRTIDIKTLVEKGIKDVSMFFQGLREGQEDVDFNESDQDYIKGYKYAKTGKF